eukprot:CAMPEP_0196770140 /NCGR_PEP_ID=MMETSP1104-20130614/965_1 /TAXON_ID=33652 /ORGANISM="Cafeteria sp., Strain Caron Lab Isolate" /LENGTH=43 /DNA_ID= /DNA_START= /DNA_END= /DNA_ORIENTATION=
MSPEYALCGPSVVCRRALAVAQGLQRCQLVHALLGSIRLVSCP